MRLRACSMVSGGFSVNCCGLVVFCPFCRKKRRSCMISLGFRSRVQRLLMWIVPVVCASVMSRGRMLRSAYSLKIVCPA